MYRIKLLIGFHWQRIWREKETLQKDSGKIVESVLQCLCHCVHGLPSETSRVHGYLDLDLHHTAVLDRGDVNHCDSLAVGHSLLSA
jgi:hypothetical protein